MQAELQQYLLTQLKEDYLKKFSDGADSHVSDTDVLNALFINYRKTSTASRGLRLSYLGTVLMKRHYDEYRYELSQIPSNKVYVMLDKNMEWPYYIGKKYVSFFNKDDAAWFRLNNSDLNSYIEQL